MLDRLRTSVFLCLLETGLQPLHSTVHSGVEYGRVWSEWIWMGFTLFTGFVKILTNTKCWGLCKVSSVHLSHSRQCIYKAITKGRRSLCDSLAEWVCWDKKLLNCCWWHCGENKGGCWYDFLSESTAQKQRMKNPRNGDKTV